MTKHAHLVALSTVQLAAVAEALRSYDSGVLRDVRHLLADSEPVTLAGAGAALCAIDEAMAVHAVSYRSVEDEDHRTQLLTTIGDLAGQRQVQISVLEAINSAGDDIV